MHTDETTGNTTFKCGLALVRKEYSYGYVDENNHQVVPFGKYSWCEPCFVGGFARVCDHNEKWGIIDVTGRVVVPMIYNKIYALQDKYLDRVKAFKGGQSDLLDLTPFASDLLFDLQYIKTYEIEEFKKVFDCQTISVKKEDKHGELFFTYGTNKGKVALKSIPQEPRISVVKNCYGRVFLLLHSADDTGKKAFEQPASNKHPKSTSHFEYEREEPDYAEDTWDAMTDGMCGDYPGDGTDYDLLG